MSITEDTLQRITVLAPVPEILSRLDATVTPVAAREIDTIAALHKALAAAVVAPSDLPVHASALQDGWAVSSEQVVDASAYAPVLLGSAPIWVDAGEKMPSGADSILPFDAVTVSGGKAEVSASVAYGEGVLPARADVIKGNILCETGKRLRSVDVAALRALGVAKVSVRAPRIKILPLSMQPAETDSIGPMIAEAVRTSGGMPEVVYETALEVVLSAQDHDAVITIGGTGSGKNDNAIKALARYGEVNFHGFAISPGQTAALGSASGHPVLMLPGRLDAALAVFLLLGSGLMGRLTGAKIVEAASAFPLTKKIASIIGLTEVIFVRRNADGIEPLGSGPFPLRALMQAAGWVLVPAGSEGVSAGTVVEMRRLHEQ